MLEHDHKLENNALVRLDWCFNNDDDTYTYTTQKRQASQACSMSHNVKTQKGSSVAVSDPGIFKPTRWCMLVTDTLFHWKTGTKLAATLVAGDHGTQRRAFAHIWLLPWLTFCYTWNCSRSHNLEADAKKRTHSPVEVHLESTGIAGLEGNLIFRSSALTQDCLSPAH